ncbi:glycosyltransferase [Algoriphagus namhaensis]|uniref:Glycosyltransferase n=1 Tax=Algoriphagus namhaensis TaxID=915353 RepID=A0ABV8AQI9_9BACT
MIWMLVVLSVYAILQFLVLTFCIQFKWKNWGRQGINECTASILIPCRNESRDLPYLLASLEKLDFPSEKLDVWLADDQSSDNTAKILSEWCSKAENRHFIQISADEEAKYHINGKANALAILSRKCEGEILFFTDADCEVPSKWLQEGVRSFPSDAGMLLGVTQVKSKGLFGKMQEVEWWHTLAIVKVTSDLGMGLTGLGNNMMVRKAALIQSGGFESLPDSLTEDLALSRQLVSQGYKVVQQVSPEILAKTKAERGIKNFLEQRKRWISGVVSLPWYFQLLLALELSFYPAIISLTILKLSLGLSIWGLKLLVQSIFIQVFASKAGQKVRLYQLYLFDFHQIVTAPLSILYYFWPSKISWKSRTYP